MVDTTTLPALPDFLGGAAPSVATPAPAGPVPNTTGNLFASALKSGGYSALSSYAGAVAAGAKFAGFDQGAANAEAHAQDFATSAQQAARSDIESKGFTGGGISGGLKYGAYELTKMLPQLAGVIGTTAAAAEVAPEAVAGGVLARAGGMLPGFLGGAEGAAGAATARNILLGGAAMAPTSIGEQYNAASEQPGGATRADAAKAIALGIPLGMVQSIGPHGATGVISSGLAHAGAFAIGGGLQEAADTSYDPTLTAGDRAQKIVQAAVSGAAMGGMFGGALGLMGHGKAPGQTTNEEMTTTVDQALAGSGSVGGGIDSFTPDQTVQPRPLRQGELDLPPIYRTQDKAPGTQGNLFQPDSLGDRPAGPMPDNTPPLDPRFVDRLARISGNDPVPNTAPDLADLAQRLANKDRKPSADFKDAMTALRRAPIAPEEAQVTPAQNDAINTAMGRPDPEVPVAEVQPPQEPVVQPPHLVDDAATPPGETAPPIADALRPTEAAPHNTVEALDAKTNLFQQFGDRDGQIGTRGVMRDWITNSTVTSEPELYNSMQDELQAKSKVSRTAGFKQMAQEIGLLDEDNKPLDLDKERAALNEIPNAGARAAEAARLDAIQERATQASMLREPAEVKPIGQGRSGLDMTPEEIAQEMNAPTRAGADAGGKTGDIMQSKALKQNDRLGRGLADLVEEQRGQEAPTANDTSSAEQSKIGTLLESMVHSGDRPDQPGDASNSAPYVPEATPEVPKSISERVMDAAHELTGGTGGEARIADIRAKLPGIASKDIDTALKEIHGDDTDNVLTQNPKGQRTGVDGVSVAGAGKFHNLSIEPRSDVMLEPTASELDAISKRMQDIREGRAEPTTLITDSKIGELLNSKAHSGDPRAFQKRSAEAQDVRDQPKSGSADGARDAQGIEAPGAKPVEGRAEDARPTGETGGAGKVEGAYPGPVEAAKRLGIVLDPKFASTNAYEAVTHRLPLMWKRALDGKFDDEYRGLYKDAQGTFGGSEALNPRRPDGTPIPHSDPMQEMTARIQRKAAGIAEPGRAPSAASKAMKGTAPGARRSPQTPMSELERQASRLTQMHNAAVKRAVETRDANGATSLPAETVGATPRETAEELRTKPETFPPPAPPKIMPKMATRNEHVLSLEEGKQIARRVLANLKPEYKRNIFVLDHQDKFPRELKEAMQRQGFNGSDVKGLYYDGKVYIRTDLATSEADLEDTISHEVFGHLGTAVQIGDFSGNGSRFEKSMLQLYNRMGGDTGFEKLARQLGVWEPNDNLLGLKGYRDELKISRAQMVDELIAHATAKAALPGDVRGPLAFIGKVKLAIAAMLREAGLHTFARRFETFTASDLQKWLQDSKDALEGRPPEGQFDLASLPGDRMTFIRNIMHADENMARASPQLARMAPRDQNDAVGSLARKVGAVSEKFKRAPVQTVARAIGNKLLDLKTTQDFVRSFSKQYPEFEKYQHAGDRGRNITVRVSQFKDLAMKQMDLLKKTDRPAFDQFVKLNMEGSLYKIDPTRPFTEQTWHRDAPNRDLLQAKHAELSAIWNKFGQPGKNNRPAGELQQLYRDYQSGMQADQALHAINTLHTFVDTLASDVRIAGFEQHAVKAIPERTDLHNDANAMRDYAQGELAKRITGLSAYLQTADRDATHGTLSTALDHIKEAQEQGQRSPYTHLGRSGDFFTSFTLKPNAARTAADPAAVQAMQDVATKLRMPDLQFNTVGGNRNVFIRFARIEQAQAFHEEMAQLGDHLDPKGKELRSGSVLDRDVANSGNITPEMSKVIDVVSKRLKGNPVAQAAAVRELRAVMVDALPDNSIALLGEQRMNVQGFSGDMLKNQAFRNQVSANAIARHAMAPELSTIKAGIIKRMDNATLGDNAVENVKTQDVGKAFLARDAASMVRVDSSLWGKLRGAAHSYYLAASPGYAIMQAAQTYTLTMPELAKNFGYARSVGALAAASKDTGIVLAAMARAKAEEFAAWKAGKVSPFGGGITPRVLELAQGLGLSKEKADFLRVLDNMGKLEMGTFSHDNLAALEHSPTSNVPAKLFRMVNATATMSELSARMMAAFSAKRLHDANPERAPKFDDVHDYAGHVVSESMYEWGGQQTSKMFSNAGPLGAASPVAFQFHGFSTRLFNKLTTETYNAVKGETEADRTEARRFMGAHLAATMTLAGSLGLPFAGWAAAAVTKGTGIFNDGEDYDVQAHYRDFLAQTFGKGLGEAIAHGLPHYVNSDFSDLGDKDLLPMTSLLEDRRKMEDSIPAYLASTWGSAIGAGVNGLLGARDIMNGRIGPGLARVMPTAMRNIVKAYQIDQHGYLDSQGRKMPIDASAVDVLKQALGMNSAEAEEQSERQRAYQGMKSDRSYHSGLIKQQIARAIESGDQESQQRWMTEMNKFDADPSHQGAQIGPTLAGYLAQRRQAMAYSQGSGLPLGFNPRDMPAMNLLNY